MVLLQSGRGRSIYQYARQEGSGENMGSAMLIRVRKGWVIKTKWSQAQLSTPLGVKHTASGNKMEKIVVVWERPGIQRRS